MSSLSLTSPIRTILVTRLDGLGDIVIGTMLLHGLHAKWPEAKIRLVVRPQMISVSAILPDWVEVKPLPFDPRQPVADCVPRIVEQLRSFASEVKADLAIIAEYNRTWAGEILAAVCGAEAVVAFDGPTGINIHHREICLALDVGSFQSWQTVHVAGEARETEKYAALLGAMQVDQADSRPAIIIRDEDRRVATDLWLQAGIESSKAIACYPGSGEGLVRSLDAPRWARWIEHLQQTRPVVLLGSEWDEPVLAKITGFVPVQNLARVIVPTDKPGVMAAFIEQAGWFIGMDTGPMHLAAVLGMPTLAVFGGGHGGHRFLPFGKRAAAIRMPIGCYGCEWHCPFDRRHCLKDIPESALHAAGDAFLSDGLENADPFQPRVYDIAPPPELSNVMLGPMMRQHRRFLADHHEVMEHHVFLAEKRAEMSEILARLSHQNHLHGDALAALSTAITEMTRQNQARDAAISHINQALAEMTRCNEERDGAISHISRTLAQMTEQNDARDGAIAHLNGVLAEMTRQNDARDLAINHLTQTLHVASK